jgi:hypothetical protein
MLKLSKKLLVLPALLAVVTAGLAFTPSQAAANSDNDKDSIVGAWEVDAAAPYRPHLLTFNEDGTMLTTNPTNVQENPANPHGGTNDSVGMGTWQLQKKQGKTYVVGTFEQVNAFADNHQPTDKLSVSFKVVVDNSSFDGPAVAKVGADAQASHLTGTRIKIDQTAVNGL